MDEFNFATSMAYFPCCVLMLVLHFFPDATPSKLGYDRGEVGRWGAEGWEIR